MTKRTSERPEEAAAGTRAVGAVGGSVPGNSGAAAFSHSAPRSMPLPVLIAVPHAGRAYSADLLARMRDPALSQLRLEDRHVDKVAVEIARATGTGLLLAHAPRAMLDLNRAEDDIDWGMVKGEGDTQSLPMPTQRKAGKAGANKRAQSGLGLVPRRLPGFGEIWREPMTREQLDDRIEAIHRPYHSFLEQELARIRDAWGAALLVDLHSMPPLRRSTHGGPRARIVLGDRFGASCDAGLVEQAFGYLERQACAAAHNRPYSGGYVLDRHAAPRRGIHALQVELCRSTYLDRAFSEPSEGLTPIATMLAGLVRVLGAATARLAENERFLQAAE
ncbi:MAG: N-formylglutamate amidohydrolase [Erythrobacter sp.]